MGFDCVCFFSCLTFLGIKEHCQGVGLMFVVLATTAVVKGWLFIFMAFIAWGYENPQAFIVPSLPLPFHTIDTGIRFTCGHRRMGVLFYLGFMTGFHLIEGRPGPEELSHHRVLFPGIFFQVKESFAG